MNNGFHHFDFLEDYILENEHVKISPLQHDHIEKLLSVANDIEVWQYFLEQGKGEHALNEYCSKAIEKRSIKKEYPFVIFDKRINEYAGMTRLYDLHEELGIVKVGHTWIGKAFWGTKLNKQCKFLLFEFIFEYLGLERIGFGVHGRNLRSIIALKSIGCMQEGLLRGYLPNPIENERIDLLLFSILKRDWDSEVKKMLKDKLK